METTYFVLGMLSIIATAIVAVLVWGIVKINKQQKTIEYLERVIDNSPRELYTRFTDIQRDIDDRCSWIHKRIDECDTGLNRRIDETVSYVDSRIDKALGTIGAKKIIKG